MSWRSYNTPQDRIYACLPYALPLIEVQMLGLFLFMIFPPLALLYVPLYPFIWVYSQLGNIFPFAGLVIFFALYILVVRNERIGHFVRFHTMQALLIDIFVTLIVMLLKVLRLVPTNLDAGFQLGLVIQIIYSAIFIGTFAAAIYSIIQAARGLYANVPLISEAAEAQTR